MAGFNTQFHATREELIKLIETWMDQHPIVVNAFAFPPERMVPVTRETMRVVLVCHGVSAFDAFPIPVCRNIRAFTLRPLLVCRGVSAFDAFPIPVCRNIRAFTTLRALSCHDKNHLQLIS